MVESKDNNIDVSEPLHVLVQIRHDLWNTKQPHLSTHLHSKLINVMIL